VRIAVYHDLPSGGAKRALFNYAKGLVGRGHTVDVYAPPTADEDFLDLRPIASGYHEVPLRSGPPPGLAGSAAARELARYAMLRWGVVRHSRAVAAAIDARGYDVAFVHHCRFTQAPYVLELLATPSVYYCQEPRRPSFEYSVRHHATSSSPGRRLLERGHQAAFESFLRPRDIRAARSATLILANSSFSVESIKRAYGRYARLAYLGIDLEGFRPTPGARRDGVISVGALHPSKGHRLVIEAAAAVAEGERPVVHVVADRSSDEHGRELADHADRLGVTLRLHEGIDDGTLVGLYGAARVAVAAAELEPFGFTPLEAMACGTPVVAVREGGYRETVVDGVNGRLVERDPRRLGEAIAALVAGGEDWERLSRGAVESAGRWTVERAVTRLEAILVDLVGAPAAPRESPVGACAPDPV
jgi:glycosyltransferase involved in cell wall biosynthesis